MLVLPSHCHRDTVCRASKAVADEHLASEQWAACCRQVVERELEEAVTLPVYGSQAALVRARDKTTLGKRVLLPGATPMLSFCMYKQVVLHS